MVYKSPKPNGTFMAYKWGLYIPLKSNIDSFRYPKMLFLKGNTFSKPSTHESGSNPNAFHPNSFGGERTPLGKLISIQRPRWRKWTFQTIIFGIYVRFRASTNHLQNGMILQVKLPAVSTPVGFALFRLEPRNSQLWPLTSCCTDVAVWHVLKSGGTMAIHWDGYGELGCGKLVIHVWTVGIREICVSWDENNIQTWNNSIITSL